MSLLRKFGFALALVLGVLAMWGMLSPTLAQTPPVPAVPKATATPVAAPPKAAVPAPAKAGNCGPSCSSETASPLQAAPSTSSSSLAGLGGAAGLVALLVAGVKALIPGKVDSRVTLIIVLAAAGVVFGLEVASHMTSGLTPIDGVSSWLQLAFGSVAAREVFTALVPGASNLPTNTGS